jgi:hypothetical protein
MVVPVPVWFTAAVPVMATPVPLPVPSRLRTWPVSVWLKLTVLVFRELI